MTTMYSLPIYEKRCEVIVNLIPIVFPKLKFFIDKNVGNNNRWVAVFPEIKRCLIITPEADWKIFSWALKETLRLIGQPEEKICGICDKENVPLIKCHYCIKLICGICHIRNFILRKDMICPFCSQCEEKTDKILLPYVIDIFKYKLLEQGYTQAEIDEIH